MRSGLIGNCITGAMLVGQPAIMSSRVIGMCHKDTKRTKVLAIGSTTNTLVINGKLSDERVEKLQEIGFV